MLGDYHKKVALSERKQVHVFSNNSYNTSIEIKPAHICIESLELDLLHRMHRFFPEKRLISREEQ